MSSSTSIGRGPAAGGNENHDGDPGNKTMGESVQQEAPAGGANAQTPALPAEAPDGSAKPAIGNGPESMPEGPNVGPSPWEVDAARGKLPPQ